MADHPYFDPKAGREAWNSMPVRTRARLAAWREVEGDISGYAPEGYRYMIENWPEVDDGRRRHAEAIEIAHEQGWSGPMLATVLRLLDGAEADYRDRMREEMRSQFAPDTEMPAPRRPRKRHVLDAEDYTDQEEQ